MVTSIQFESFVRTDYYFNMIHFNKQSLLEEALYSEFQLREFEASTFSIAVSTFCSPGVLNP